MNAQDERPLIDLNSRNSSDLTKMRVCEETPGVWLFLVLWSTTPETAYAKDNFFFLDFWRNDNENSKSYHCFSSFLDMRISLNLVIKKKLCKRSWYNRSANDESIFPVCTPQSIDHSLVAGFFLSCKRGHHCIFGVGFAGCMAPSIPLRFSKSLRALAYYVNRN